MATSSLPPGAFLIVVNAQSGHASLRFLQETIEAILGGAGRGYRLTVVHDPQHLQASVRQAIQDAQACQGALVIAGGDGTIHTAVNLLQGGSCPLGILPMGTFNYFARDQGIPQDLQQAVRALLHATVQPVALGLVNQRRFLVNASLGLYPQLLEEREAFKERFGRRRLVAWGAALVTFLHQHRPLRLILEHQGSTRQLRTLTLFISNNRLQARQLGLALSPAEEQPQLVALALRPGGTWAMLGLLVRSAFGRLGDAANIQSFSFTRLLVKPSSLYRTRRVKVAMDGEVTWLRAPLEFRVAPEPLYLLKPTVTDEEQET